MKKEEKEKIFQIKQNYIRIEINLLIGIIAGIVTGVSFLVFEILFNSRGDIIIPLLVWMIVLSFLIWICFYNLKIQERKNINNFLKTKNFKEIKKIKKMGLDKLRDWGFFILAIATLLIGIFSWVSYVKTNPTIKPNIEVDLFDTNSYSVSGICSIGHLNDGTLFKQSGIINFGISNLGLKNTNYMNIYVKDPNAEYIFQPQTIPDLKSLDNTFVQIEFWSIECQNEYLINISKNITYSSISEECEQIAENLTEGKREFLLKIDCPGCKFKERFQCYSFDLCIYNLNRSICGENIGYYNLNKKDCPLNW